ncbi:MAG: ATP synthase F1 subunit gamma, partial [Gemmatimonadetes bacterium]|nr:ATP synthase F1 subunit gamma [Gemmatimonadota bacterium]
KTADRLHATRPYADKLGQILSQVNLAEYIEQFPLLQKREEVKRVALLVVTTNRGLCGAFNASVIRMARDVAQELTDDGVSYELHVIGRKGANALRYMGYEVASKTTNITDWPSFEDARLIAETLQERFLDGTVDELRIVYSNYVSVASQKPVTETILPMQVGDDEEVTSEYILEPSAEEILENLIPAIINNRIFKALLETAAGEQAARRVAMKNATDNAEEIKRLLTRSYNRARQAKITQEIAEIVGGAEALN